MRFCGRVLSVFLFLLLVIGLLSAQGPASSVAAASSFEPLEHWRQAVLAGDSAALQAMYSTQPPVIIKGSITESQGPDEELKFWKERKEAGLTSLTFDDLEVKPGENKKNEQVIFQAVITSTPATGTARTWYLRAVQYWQEQKGGWRIVQVVRGELTRLELPMHSHMAHHNLFPPDADAHAELNQALAAAAKEKKHVLIVFGANWSYDCHVLDLAFHRPDLEPLVEKNYVVLHVDIGGSETKNNHDLAERFQVPLEKGVPALAVVKSDGTLLFSQRNGEFKSIRTLGPEDLEAFLEKWKRTKE